MIAPLLIVAFLSDVLCLADGRIVDGKELERAEGGVTIHFEAGDVFVSDDLILDCIIEGEVESYQPRDEREREKLEKGYVRYEGRWVTARAREKALAKRLEERRTYAESLEEHSLWRNRLEQRTKHFEFEYTVPQHIFADYRDRMEAYFTAFMKDWKVKPPRKNPRLKVCFYGDAEAFHQVSGAGSYTLGYFRFVDPMELDIYYDRLDPQGTEEVMFHEANHYLQKLLDLDFSMPHFPGESLAEYYGSSAWDPEKSKLTIGVVLEGRLTEVQTNIAAGEMIGLRELIVEREYEHYTWGWTLVHFLMNDKRYEKKLRKFITALPGAKDIERPPPDYRGLRTVVPAEVWNAFQKYLGLTSDEDVAQLEREWHDYIQNTLEVESVHGHEQAGLAALRRGRPLRAKRLLGEAIAKGSTNGLCFYRYGCLLAGDQDWDAAVENIERALELDPLNADYYAGLSGTLRRSGKKASAEKWLALAREIAPDDPYLQAEASLRD